MATHPLHFDPNSNSGSHSVRPGLQTSELRWRYSASLGAVGGLLVLMSLWGGIMPFVGRSFDFSPDGLGLYHFDLARGLLAVLPAGAGLLAGLSLMQFGRVASLGFGRLGITTAGVLAIAAGCWFVIGPVAWPVLEGQRYLLSSGAYAAFECELAYALGPGLFLVVMGALACEFAAMQRADASRVAVAVTTTAVPTESDPARLTSVELGARDATEITNEVD